MPRRFALIIKWQGAVINMAARKARGPRTPTKAPQKSRPRKRGGY